jgi:hypothetical protein
MKRLPEGELVEAFALSSARGAELLERLGGFNVWSGDLAAMRNDEPHVRRDVNAEETPELEAYNLVDTLVLARAIEILQPICRAALSSIYAHRSGTGSVATELDTSPENAERLVTNCEKRLLEIYESLVQSSGDSRAVPNWVSEREHVAVSGIRRR